jgi:L-asparaginase / beta-aspartyl-peptidase
MKYTLAIHGGAGTITGSQMSESQEIDYNLALSNALKAGEKILKNSGTSLDAVEAAVRSLEDNPLFNAGMGSVFAHSGKHEMEASIMDGSNLKAGAVAAIKNVRNPISLSRLVMDKSGYVMMCASGAEEFGRKQMVQFEEDDYFYTAHRYEQLMEIRDTEKVLIDHSAEQKFGTVGAVALDIHGNLAAATSTGGLTNKRYGRLGDSSVIGSGTYANNATCAVSCTGYGEYFLRAVVAHDISCLMEYKGLSLSEACHTVVNKKLVAMGGEGGVIAVDALGNIELAFNSEGMYRGLINSEVKEPLVLIYK